MDYNGSRTEAKYWMYRIRYDDWEAWYAAVAFPHSNKIDLLVQKYQEFNRNSVVVFRQLIVIFDRKCEKCNLYYIMYESSMRSAINIRNSYSINHVLKSFEEIYHYHNILQVLKLDIRTLHNRTRVSNKTEMVFYIDVTKGLLEDPMEISPSFIETIFVQLTIYAYISTKILSIYINKQIWKLDKATCKFVMMLKFITTAYI